MKQDPRIGAYCREMRTNSQDRGKFTAIRKEAPFEVHPPWRRLLYPPIRKPAGANSLEILATLFPTATRTYTYFYLAVFCTASPRYEGAPMGMTLLDSWTQHWDPSSEVRSDFIGACSGAEGLLFLRLSYIVETIYDYSSYVRYSYSYEYDISFFL